MDHEPLTKSQKHDGQYQTTVGAQITKKQNKQRLPNQQISTHKAQDSVLAE